MNQEIKYSGFSAVPSDYECSDGSLAVSINLLPEDGTLKPILAPSDVMQLQDGEVVKFIHKTSSFTHYIIYNTGKNELSWRNKDGNTTTRICSFYGLTHCNAVGNTLLAFSNEQILYLLWESDKYTSLGNHLPNIQVSFGLIGHPRLFSLSDSSKSTFTISFDKISKGNLRNEFSDNNKTRITEQVMAKLNKFIREQTIDNGRFCFPFFVRYALRLFDGSLVCHSAPVLMNPATTPAPIVLWTNAYGDGGFTNANCDIMMMACSLDYKVLRVDDYYDLDKWKDIITSIDVFISKPIYTYDQDGKISYLADTDNLSSKFIGRLYHDGYTLGSTATFASSVSEDKVLAPISGDNTFLDHYLEWDYKEIYKLYFSPDRSNPAESFHLPEFTDNKNYENLKDCSSFYKLHSITLDDAKATARTEIPIENEYLQSLVTREAMTDDYLTHDRLVASFSQVYNSRLNLSGIKREPYAGFTPYGMFAYCDKTLDTYKQDGKTLSYGLSWFDDTLNISVYIKEGGKTYMVRTEGNYACWMSKVREHKDPNTNEVLYTEKTKTSCACYLFYPNPNAVKMVINSRFGYDTSTAGFGGGSMIIDLRPHDFLNGAYAMIDYESIRWNNYNVNNVPTITDYEGKIDIPNKIYTSEVNNPFYFPVLGINTVGTGEIKGICSAAKALSEGQFGQFPLYAFTSEGVWALEVSSTGTYSAKQPITRDVCINPDGITQLDSAVLFPTDRGIMLISGSQTQCISEAINSEYPFDALRLPGFDKLHTMLGHEPTTDKCLPTLSFTKFLKQCRMLYDYVHQRVIVYAPGITYAYVFSLKTNQWGMMFSNIASHLNSYPDALAMDTKNAVLNFSVPVTDTVKCLYVTRPLKLEAANVLKTVASVIQRGLFRKGNVSTALYGSRDLQNWHLVWSSKDHYLQGFRGSPYKYFRIAGVATLSPDENIYGASVEFTPRQTNKPR